MKTIQTYHILNNSQYGRVRAYFRDSEAIGERFGEYRYNAIKRCIDGTDPSHVNDLLEASRGVSRFRETERIIRALHLPFPGNTKQGFEAHKKMGKAQRDRMTALRADWENILIKEEMNAEDNFKKQKKDKPEWTAESAIDKLFDSLEKHGVENIAEIVGARLQERFNQRARNRIINLVIDNAVKTA